MSIITDAMLANLRIGIWQGYRLDRNATSFLTHEKSADEDAARVNKHLLSKADLSKIVSAANKMRNQFYLRTLPWKDNGDRLLPRKSYFTFMAEHGKLLHLFNQATEEFCQTTYPQVRANAEARMGDMFDSADYPPVESISSRFYAELDIDSVTTANDFRVQMDDLEHARICSQIEASLRERIAAAAFEPWNRLSSALSRFVEFLGPDCHLQPKSVAAIQELAEVIPQLNFTNDARISAICRDIEGMFQGVTAKDIRETVATRTAIKSQVNAILDHMRDLGFAP